MKIGFFTETYLPHLNGVSVTLAFEKEKLEKLGHKVTVFAPKVAGAEDKSDIVRLSSMKVLNSEPEQKMVLPIPNATLRKTFRVGLDVVHAHGGGLFSFLGYQLALAKGYPFVLTYHTYLTKYLHYFFIKNYFLTSRAAISGSKLFCNLADIVIVPSEKMKKILEGYGVTKRIEVVPNPIDTSKFRKVESSFLRDKLNLKPDTLIFLTASRLGKEKNIDFLLKAFAIVAKKNKNSVFVILGDGPEKTALQELTKELSLEKRVYFTGYISSEKMPEVYSDSGIFLFASTSETQGMVIPEAAACGLPLVVVEDQAFAGAVQDFVNGYETKMKVSVFARKLLSLAENSSKREQFGLESQRLIKKNFDPDKIIMKLETVYKDAIEIRRNQPRVSNRVQSRFKNLIGIFGYVKELNKRLGF